MTRVVREMDEADGIRSYGPGKFYTILDSQVFDTIAVGNWADEEAGYGEGNGWFWLVWLDDEKRERIDEVAQEHSHIDGLTDEEWQLLEDTEAVIMYERTDGIVEVDYYDSKKKAQSAWKEIEEDTASDEGDE